MALWGAAALTALLAAAPPLVAWALPGTVSAVDDRDASHAVFHVRGIDCEACATPLRRALAKHGGFRALTLDIPKQRVLVSYDAAPGRIEAYVKAIEELGYEASVVEEAP